MFYQITAHKSESSPTCHKYWRSWSEATYLLSTLHGGWTEPTHMRSNILTQSVQPDSRLNYTQM